MCIGEPGLVVAHDGVAGRAEGAGECREDRVGRLEGRDEAGGEGGVAGWWRIGCVGSIEDIGKSAIAGDAKNEVIGDVIGLVLRYDWFTEGVEKR